MPSTNSSLKSKKPKVTNSTSTSTNLIPIASVYGTQKKNRNYLNNLGISKSLNLTGNIFSLGLRWVTQGPSLVPSPSKQLVKKTPTLLTKTSKIQFYIQILHIITDENHNLAVVTDGEGVTATGNNRTDFVRLKSFDNANPFFLFVVSYS